MIVAIDIGTTNCKGCGFHVNTFQPATPWFRREYDVPSSPDCWFEVSREILTLLRESNRELIPQYVVLSGMMQNVIIPDEQSPICILYNDAEFARSAHDELEKKEISNLLQATTKNYKGSASVAAKLFQINQINLLDSKKVLFGAHSYVAWKLLGCKSSDFYCDITTASTTGLLDPLTLDWLNLDLIKNIGIGNFQLPRLLKDSSEIVGFIEKLPGYVNVPLIHGAGDLGSLILAVECFDLKTHAYLGTSGWVASIRERGESKNSEAFVLAHPTQSSSLEIHAMPTTCAGFNASKISDLLFSSSPMYLDQRAALSNRRFSLLYFPYLRGERGPIAMPSIRAAFFGITADTTADDLALAVLCGVGYHFRWLYESLNIMQAKEEPLLLLGGGSRSKIWCQLFANIINLPIRSLTSKDFDETVLGAASLAFKSLDKNKIRNAFGIWDDIAPEKEEINYHDKIYPTWKKAVILMKDLFYPGSHL